MSKEALKSATIERAREVSQALRNRNASTWDECDREAVFAIDALVAHAEWLAARKQPEQKPVAFYVYKPTLPRGHLGNVSDGDLPWVYDQDPSSGYSARMLVYTTPPQRKPLTDEQISEIGYRVYGMKSSTDMQYARAIEAAHGIKGDA